MKKLISSVCLIAIAFIYLPETASAQNQTEFSPKWEMGVDLLPLIDKANDPFGFIIRKNHIVEEKGRAWRIRIAPRFVTGPSDPKVSSRQNSFRIGTGYEWQRHFGSFSYFYGIDAFYKYYKSEVKNGSLLVDRQTENALGISTFVGFKYFIGKRVSTSLESHLQYQYQDFESKTPNVGSGRDRSNSFQFIPISSIFLSYYF